MADVVWGLDIGDWSLKIVRGRFEKKSRRITVDLFDTIRYGDLPCGYEAETLDKYREGVRAFEQRHTVGKGEALCVAIPGNEVFSRFINLPPVPERLHEIIRFEARQQIPFDIDRVVWDYQRVREQEEIGEEIEVGIFALKEERINEFTEMLRPWEHNIQVIQDAPLAVYNFLRFEGLADEPIIVLDMGAHSTDVIVLNHPRFWIRSLLAGGDNISAALRDNFGVSAEEAERIKDRAARAGRQAQILRVVRPVIDNLVSEIQRSLGYYKSIARGVKFERVLLLGNAFRFSGLDRVLSDGLQYEVEKLQELRKFDLAPSVDRAEFLKELPGACTALGLLVQGFKQSHMKISLVPEEVVLKGQVRRKKPWAVASALAVVLIAIAFIVAENLYGKELGKGSGIGQDLLAQISKSEEGYRAVEAEIEELKNKLDDLAVGGLERGFFLRFIPVFSSTIPEQVYVTDLSFEWMEESEIFTLREGGRREGAIPGIGIPGMPGLDMGPGVGPGGMPGPGVGPAGMPAGATTPGEGEMPGLAPGMPPEAIGIPGMGPEMAPGVGYARTAQKGRESKLVAVFTCESTLVRRGLDFINKEVIGRLEELKLPGEAKPVFKEVKLIEGPVDVYRSSLDGRKVSARGPLERATGRRREREATPVPTEGFFGPEMGPGVFGPEMGPGVFGPEGMVGADVGAFRAPEEIALRSGVKEERLHFVWFRCYAVFELGQE